MFGGPPAGYVPTVHEQDMAARLVPSDLQAALAADMIAAADRLPANAREAHRAHGEPLVVVPIALPGKRYGFWTEGQDVEHPPGLFLAFERADGGSHSYGTARNLAENAAQQWLDLFHDGKGSPAYCLISRDTSAAVFEGFNRNRADS